jgi:prepilin-type N-terminal cleavage/methylation domain-containing protein
VRGFTLLELIIVAVILAIIAAITISAILARRAEAQGQEPPLVIPQVVITRIGSASLSNIYRVEENIYRVEDLKTGIVCYAYAQGGIACVQPSGHTLLEQP